MDSSHWTNGRRKEILLVDDDDECRLSPMSSLLAQKYPMLEVVSARTVTEALRLIQKRGHLLRAASLDHDLSDHPFDRSGHRLRPTLTGHDITAFLATLTPAFPVLVHTSSSVDGRLMAERLKASGWTAKYVSREGETPQEWLEKWGAIMSQHLVDAIPTEQ
jgi:hypothetical protein